MNLLLVTSLVIAVGFSPRFSALGSLSDVCFDFSVLQASLQSANEDSLAGVRRSDRLARDGSNKLASLPPLEHLRRANVYMANRAFDEARAHWQALIEYYPQDPKVPEAMFGIGRSYLQSRRYEEAYSSFDLLARRYASTKEGREGLNFSAAALLRLGKPSEAAERYIEYIEHFPDGERIDTAHLNAIDTLREAGQPQQAMLWVARTRQRFAGTATEINALFGKLRLDVAERDWKNAVFDADELRRKGFARGVLTTPAEVAYLKAYSLEQAGNSRDAFAAYQAIPDGLESYYGGLATQRLQVLADGRNRDLVNGRAEVIKSEIAEASALYPVPYRQAVLTTTRRQKLDPRLMLAIIRQESAFRSTAKSPAGARGLLQLTIDAARKYAPSAGLNNLQENELYRPETSISVGGEYMAELTRMFPDLPEAVAASYNGGEDNVARWVKRAKHNDPGVFTSEIGFDETKAYVQKVMSNYRAYRQLYTADLLRR
jgi:peptidoglycan lytic transglycosylase